AISLRLLGLFLFISFGASDPHINAGEARPPYKFLRYDEDYSFLSDPTQRTDLFDWLNISYSMALDISPSAARCANVSRLIRMKNSAPIRIPTMPTCYSVTFSTPITIRPSGCGFSRNCKVRSKAAGPAGHGRRIVMP